MSAWTEFEPSVKRPALRGPETRVNQRGTLVVSAELAVRLGDPERVVVLTDGGADRFAIRAASHRMGSRVFRDYGGRARCVCVQTLLRELGKRHGVAATLPHSWEEDTLVIDCSGLPAADAAS